jgi:hypothetical protein
MISFSLRVASSRPASEMSDELACGFTPSSFEIHLVVQSRFRTTKVPSRRTSLLGSHLGPDVSVCGLLEESFAILYLNVTHRANSMVNGVVFVVTQNDLQSYDQREWIYDRISVTNQLVDLEARGGDVWLYEGKPEHILSPPDDWRKASVRSTYLTIVKNGLSSLGPEFTQRFWANTDPVPEWLVVDDCSVE